MDGSNWHLKSPSVVEVDQGETAAPRSTTRTLEVVVSPCRRGEGVAAQELAWRENADGSVTVKAKATFTPGCLAPASGLSRVILSVVADEPGRARKRSASPPLGGRSKIRAERAAAFSQPAQSPAQPVAHDSPAAAFAAFPFPALRSPQHLQALQDSPAAQPPLQPAVEPAPSIECPGSERAPADRFAASRPVLRAPSASEVNHANLPSSHPWAKRSIELIDKARLK